MTEDPFAGRLLRAGSFWELVTARAAASGDAPMLLDSAGHRVSFKEFKDYSERTAASLPTRGIEPGTRVAWQLPTRISTIVAMAALARLGAIQAPVIPIYREREGDIGSMAFPVAHVGGIIYILAQLISGFPIVGAEAFDASTLELFRRLSVTMSGGSTVFCTALLAGQRAFASAPDSRAHRVVSRVPGRLAHSCCRPCEYSRAAARRARPRCSGRCARKWA